MMSSPHRSTKAPKKKKKRKKTSAAVRDLPPAAPQEPGQHDLARQTEAMAKLPTWVFPEIRHPV